MKRIKLYPTKEKSLQRRHPWVFSGACNTKDLRGVQAGEIVEITTQEGLFLARGYYEEGSIAVRILTFNEEEKIDPSFWYNHLYNALLLRQALGLTKPEGKSSYRLIHGEGDGLPGLIIDIYGSTAVIQAHTTGIHLARTTIAQALKNIYNGGLQCIYYKSASTLVTSLPVNEPLDTVLYGHSKEEEVEENGIRFSPDIIKGQKTGFFLDQRDNRVLLGKYASGRRVLNMFCYTGGFSLYALQEGATSITSLDSSAKAIQLLERNIALNNFPVERHTSTTEDAFDFLDKMPKDAYDLIVLDPPAFAKRRSVLSNALQGYRRINTLALQKISSGGILFTFSCSQAVSVELFRQSIFTSALLANRNVRILHTLTQAPDHPVSICHPEGEYLKGLVLYVE